MTDATMKVANPLDLPVTLTFTTTMREWQIIRESLRKGRYSEPSTDIILAIDSMLTDLETAAKWPKPEEE